jgi:hypothetical protein
MKIRIRNTTPWRTDDLRRAIRATCDAMGITTDRSVDIVPTRQQCWITGCARYHSRWMKIRIPSLPLGSPDTLPTSLVFELCRVIHHELMHCQGFRHAQMPKIRDVSVPWSAGLIVRRKPAKAAVPKPERLASLVEKRHAHAIEKERELARRIKTLTTRRKVWARKVRYYEKKAAAGKAVTP